MGVGVYLFTPKIIIHSYLEFTIYKMANSSIVVSWYFNKLIRAKVK